MYLASCGYGVLNAWGIRKNVGMTQPRELTSARKTSHKHNNKKTRVAYGNSPCMRVKLIQGTLTLLLLCCHTVT